MPGEPTFTHRRLDSGTSLTEEIMLVRTHSRLVLAAPGAFLVLLSLVGCFGGGGRRSRKQNGQDVLISGSSPAMTSLDSAAGDVILAGSDVTFFGSAGGDYLGAGGNQKIAGRVHGSIRAVGGDVQVSGSADRNATIAGGNVELDSSAVIAGNAYLAGGNVKVHGTVRGGLLATAGNVDL